MVQERDPRRQLSEADKRQLVRAFVEHYLHALESENAMDVEYTRQVCESVFQKLERSQSLEEAAADGSIAAQVCPSGGGDVEAALEQLWERWSGSDGAWREDPASSESAEREPSTPAPSSPRGVGLSAAARAFVPGGSAPGTDHVPPQAAAPPSARPFPSPRPSESEAVSLLQDTFPIYATQVLADILHAAEGDLARAMRMLSDLEGEQEREARALQDARLAAAAREQARPAFGASDFPALGRTKSQAEASPAPGDEDHERDFPTLGAQPGAPAARPLAGPGSNYARAASQRMSSRGASAPAPPSARAPPSTSRARARPVHEASGVPQFATGASVAAAYASARAEAAEWAAVRNRCFAEATRAYLAGSKALARQLGAQGREAAERMRASHASAADRTFAGQNQGGGGEGGGTVDLHGLHVREALERVEWALQEARSRRQRRIRFVVGVGRHSSGGSARVGPAVKEHLGASRDVSWTELFAGMVEATLLDV